MFLDERYFDGELYLPYFKRRSLDGAGRASLELQTVAESTLDWFVEKYERECLELLLGKGLYGRFVEGLEDAEGADYGAWMALRDCIFMKRGRYGFSAVANYVYFFLMRNGRSRTSGVGEVVGKMDHAVGVDNRGKLVKVWNDMCRMAEDVRGFVCEHEDVYGKAEGLCCFKRMNCFGL